MGVSAMLPTETLWPYALAAIPLALFVVLLTRLLPCRPATRHMLWLVVLVWLLAAPLLPQVPTGLADPLTFAQSWLPIESKLVSPAAAKQDAVQPDSAQGNLGLASADLPETSDDVQSAVRDLQAKLHNPDTKQNLALPSWRRSAARTTGARTARSPTGEKRRRAYDGADAPKSLAQATCPGGPLTLFEPNRDRDRQQPRLRDVDRASTGGSSSAVRPGKRIVVDMSSERATARNLAPFSGYPCRPSSAPPSRRAVKAVPRLQCPPTSDPSAVSTLSPAPYSTPRPGYALPPPGAIPQAMASTQHTPERVDRADEKPPSTGLTFWREWASAVLAMREMVTELPPIPGDIWIVGAVMLALLILLRTLQFRRRIASATAAPPSVRRMVVEAAQALGLRNIPQTWMIGRRMSPMVWCGRRPRLILPTRLWSELDEAGRRAVIYHELAHVRRRDHWVSWAEAIVGLLYWWHPLVWWIRSRLHAEAELCCDAWVTSLLPTERRAYAEALLRTKQYAHQQTRWVPTTGIAVTTGRAGRFARRLTMVMTKSVKPRLSVTGIVLVLAVAGSSWLATPARSCPPKEKPVKAGVHKHDATTPAPCRHCKENKLCAKCEKAKAESYALRTFEQYMAQRGQDAPNAGSTLTLGSALGYAPLLALGAGSMALGGPDDDELEEQLERLGAELDRLGRELAKLTHDCVKSPRCKDAKVKREKAGCKEKAKAKEAKKAKRGKRRAEGRAERRVEVRKERSRRRPCEGRTPGPHAPCAPCDPCAPCEPCAPCAPSPPSAPSPPCPPCPPIPPVPHPEHVFVAPDPRVVVAPDLDMTFFGVGDEGEDLARVYKLPKGKLEALTQLMVRSDVPVLVRPLDDAIEVHGNRKQQHVFGAFVHLIHPSKDGRSEVTPEFMMAPSAGELLERLARGEAVARPRAAARAATAFRDAMRRQREHIKGFARERASLEVKMRAIEEAAESLEERADEVREAADELREKAEELREAADELRSSVDPDDESKAREIEAKAEALERQARDIEQQSEAIEHQAEILEEQAEELEERAEEIEERIEELEDRLTQRSKAFEEALEAHEEAVTAEEEALIADDYAREAGELAFAEAVEHAQLAEEIARVAEEEAQVAADEANAAKERALAAQEAARAAEGTATAEAEEHDDEDDE